MEINEALSLVTTVIQEVRAIREACLAIPIGLWKPTKENLSVLQEKLSSLENKIGSAFPILKQIVLAYSELKSDVGIARALSDKASEILILAPNLAGSYVIALISPAQNEYVRIASKIRELPALDSREAGELNEKLRNIEIHIRDLQRFIDSSGTEGIQEKARAVASKFRSVSREYGGIESKLSELLNGRILKDFDIS